MYLRYVTLMPVERTLGIVVASSLMILFGAIEVVTGFNHEFAGISTSTSNSFTVIGVAIGAIYSVAGLLTLTMKRLAILFAIGLLIVDILGRLGLVATGLFPLSSTENVVGIAGGTGIATIFAVYLWVKVRSFSPRWAS